MSNDTIIRVLLIGDNENDFRMIRAILLEADPAHYDSTHVETFDAGVQILHKGNFDLALVDFQLRQKTGLNFLDEVARRDITVPVIMVSGQGDEMAAAAAIKKGAAEYLPKTQAALEELPRVIQRVLRERDVILQKRVERDLTNRQQVLNQVLKNTPGFVFQAVLHQDGSVTYPHVSDQAAAVFEDIEMGLNDKPFDLFKRLTANSRQMMRQRLGRLLRNQREATVFEELEIEGSDRPFDLFKHLTADSREKMQQRLEKISLGQREATSCKLQFVTPGGNTKWLQFSWIPRPNNDGTIELNGVGIDITAAETLRRQQQSPRAHES